jgi:hypothetical protein
MDFLYIILGTLLVFGIAAFSYFIAGVSICLIADVILFFTKENGDGDKNELE